MTHTNEQAFVARHVWDNHIYTRDQSQCPKVTRLEIFGKDKQPLKNAIVLKELEWREWRVLTYK